MDQLFACSGDEGSGREGSSAVEGMFKDIRLTPVIV